MIVKINCTYNDRGPWCTNKNIKRAFFGIVGARMCPLYEIFGAKCEYQNKKINLLYQVYVNLEK